MPKSEILMFITLTHACMYVLTVGGRETNSAEELVGSFFPSKKLNDLQIPLPK